MRAKKYISQFFLIVLFSSTQAQNIWTQKADYGEVTYYATAFSIGDKGYIGIGYFANSNHLWEYDPVLDIWTQVADFPGEKRDGYAASFSIGLKGYVGTGYISATGKGLKDFWEYDSESNTWTPKADFGGGKRIDDVGFSIEDKGYIGLGFDNNYINQQDLWEYDPSTDVWTQKADISGGPRAGAAAFTIEGKSYVGGGANDTAYLKDFWEYDPSVNVWYQKADFGGLPRERPVGFSIGNKGYIGTGFSYDKSTHSNHFYKDFWQYDVSNNTWVQVADFGGKARVGASGFSINGKGYVGTGDTLDEIFKDFWEYSPDTSSTCEIAAGEYANNITSNSAILNWNLVGGAEGYKIRYKISGTSEWTKRTTSKDHKKITGLSSGTQYVWEIKTYCTIAPNLTSDWSDKQYFTTLPVRLGNEEAIASLQVFPNPFSTSTTISFSLAENSQVTIELIDLSGRKLKTILNGYLEAGINSVNLSREQLAAGIYFIKLKVNEAITIEKLLVQ